MKEKAKNILDIQIKLLNLMITGKEYTRQEIVNQSQFIDGMLYMAACLKAISSEEDINYSRKLLAMLRSEDS